MTPRIALPVAIKQHLSKALATTALLVTISAMGQAKLVGSTRSSPRMVRSGAWPRVGRWQNHRWVCVVHLFKDNVEMSEVASNKKGRFELELDLDQTYTLELVKEGFMRKYIYLDTSVPKDLVQYPSYECTVGLEKNAASNIDPFYRDFPSAIIRYDAELGGFNHNEHYYTHIQTKLVGYANAGQYTYFGL